MNDDLLHHKIAEWMDGHSDEYVQFLQKLIRSASVQGHEREAQEMIAEKLAALGLEVDMWEPQGHELHSHPHFCSPRSSFAGSPNVVGIWRGTGGGRSLLLNGHVDVVPAGDREQWEADPFSGEMKEGKIYGRGATDMKGGNVALIMAVACLKDLGVCLQGDVFIESVIEEESGGAGTLAAILRGYKADAALIPEPTGMRIFPKQQGSMWFRILIKGRSAHGGTRYEGVSAIEKAMLVVEEIRRLEQTRNEQIHDPLYTNTPIPIPINVGVIAGGEWPSSVPDLVRLEGRMGVAPGETLENAKQEMSRCLAKTGERDDWLAKHPPELEWFGARWVPGSIDMEHEWMNVLIHNYRQVLAKEPVVEASPWGTDGGLLSKVGDMPVVVFGPGATEVAHFPNEYIELDKMLQFAGITALAMLEWCGKEQHDRDMREG